MFLPGFGPATQFFGRIVGGSDSGSGRESDHVRGPPLINLGFNGQLQHDGLIAWHTDGPCRVRRRCRGGRSPAPSAIEGVSLGR
ncbi:hypothetical protein AArcCO_0438 [Halalkaliarchaeum sp. AArc-CO]|nr:hypothetical protein AArcCO_0438 [Halalkaliarchaeum sp. AArc-CO]